MAAGQTQLWVIERAVTAWRDAFAALTRMPVALGVGFLAVLALNCVGAIFIPRKVGEPQSTTIELLKFILDLGQGFLLTLAVHRFVLLGERAASYRLEPAEPRFWRFFGFTVLLQVMFGVPGAIIGLTEKASDSGGMAIGLAGFVLLIIAGIVTLRTLILFPAIAVDAPGADWGNALRDSKGHSWRLLFIVIVVAVPLMLIYTPMFFWLSWPGGPSARALAILLPIEAAVVVLMAAVYAALASRLFAALADRLAVAPGMAPPPPAAG